MRTAMVSEHANPMSAAAPVLRPSWPAVAIRRTSISADAHSDRLRAALACATPLAPEPQVAAEVNAVLQRCAGVLALDHGLGILAQPGIRRKTTGAPPRCPIVGDPDPRGSVPVPAGDTCGPGAAVRELVITASGESSCP